MTPAMADLLHHHRRTIAELEDQIERMQEHRQGKGGFGTLEGSADTTEDSILRTQEQVDRLKALVEKHDPDGYTVIR